MFIRFLDEINHIHPTLKFTNNFPSPYQCSTPKETTHSCFCYTTTSIPFLDTQVSIKNNKLMTDLFRKPTDRCNYLLPSSCHPQHITRNIPYSLAYRIVRICSDRQILLSRLEELKNLLLSRDYHPKVVNAAIERALKVPRETALKKVEAASTERVVFVTDFHPALPSISSILCKSWRIMTKDPYLKEVFPEPPLVAYRKPKNSSLREMLVKSKVPEEMPTRSQRQTNGTKKCRKSGCMCCPFLQEGNTVTSTASNFTHKIEQSLTCVT